MDDQFVNWEDLDLDSLLGEYTDDDEEFIEVEEDPASSECEVADRDTENHKPKSKSKRAKSNTKMIFSCPICSKEYRSASGFRGHVSKKHNKPELKGKL